MPVDPESNTILSVRLAPDEGKDEWYVAWERHRAGMPPIALIREKSTLVGGMLGLEATLSTLWEPHDAEHSVTLLFAEYELSGYKSQLLTSRRKTIEPQKWIVENTGAFWQIRGAPQLIAASVSRNEGHDALNAVAIGGFRIGGWPNVTALETQLWQDLQQVVQEGW